MTCHNGYAINITNVYLLFVMIFVQVRMANVPTQKHLEIVLWYAMMNALLTTIVLVILSAVYKDVIVNVSLPGEVLLTLFTLFFHYIYFVLFFYFFSYSFNIYLVLLLCSFIVNFCFYIFFYYSLLSFNIFKPVSAPWS